MDFTDVLGGITGLVGTGYNLYANKRDFDYQKALQQQLFEREDTAIQRRMADLKAAGINPNLAAGSGAGAGSIVSRSNTNDVNFGAALDTMAAVNQIKLQKQEQKQKKAELDILDKEKKMKDMEIASKSLSNLLQEHETLFKMGIPNFLFQNSNGTRKIIPLDIQNESIASAKYWSDIFDYNNHPDLVVQEGLKRLQGGYQQIFENQSKINDQQLTSLLTFANMNNLKFEQAIKKSNLDFTQMMDVEKLKARLFELGIDIDLAFTKIQTMAPQQGAAILRNLLTLGGF